MQDIQYHANSVEAERVAIPNNKYTNLLFYIQMIVSDKHLAPLSPIKKAIQDASLPHIPSIFQVSGLDS